MRTSGSSRVGDLLQPLDRLTVADAGERDVGHRRIGQDRTSELTVSVPEK